MSLSEFLKKTLKEKKRKTWQVQPEILICPNVPKPMHGVAPREILGRKWWNKTRKEAYASTNYHCLACGVHKSLAKSRRWLEGHELYSLDYQEGRMTYLRTVPLCHYCHNYIHDGRLLALLSTQKLRPSKYTAIIQHGDRVLAKANLSRDPYDDREMVFIEMVLDGKVAPWKHWRLVLFGKEYPPKFKSELMWRKAFEK